MLLVIAACAGWINCCYRSLPPVALMVGCFDHIPVTEDGWSLLVVFVTGH